jgi:hypothetical protein
VVAAQADAAADGGPGEAEQSFSYASAKLSQLTLIGDSSFD